MSSRVAVLTLSAAASILVASCGGLLEPAAAVVRGGKITVEQIDRAVDEFRDSREFQRLAQGGDAQALLREFEQNYLSQEIRRAVLLPEAETLDIEVTEAEIEEELDLIRSEFASEGAFQEALREQGITPAQLRTLVRDRLLEDELRAEVTGSVTVSGAELRAYYRANRDQFTDTAVRHIQVDNRALAQRISERLQQTTGDRQTRLFARLAERHSQDRSSKDLGGDLGFFSPGDFVRPFEIAAFRLKVGEVSDPVRTEFGWHVIRVDDRVRRDFAAARVQIEEIVVAPRQDDAWEQWLNDVYEEADVKVNPRYGELDPVSKTVVDPGPDEIPGADAPSPSPSL